MKLIYSISFGEMNSLSSVLNLYNDNTFEFKYSNNSNISLVEKGTYNYNIDEIIGAIDETEEVALFWYYIKDEKGNVYVTNDKNTKLKEFLLSLDIDL